MALASLRFGLQPPPEALRAWGMRADYDDFPCTLTWCADRTDVQELPEFKLPVLPDQQQLDEWTKHATPFNDFLHDAWKWLQDYVNAELLAGSDERIICHVDPVLHGTDDKPTFFVLEASMRRSFGYCFIVVYELPVYVPLRHTESHIPVTKAPETPRKREARGLSKAARRRASRW